ncbi:molybdate ABC transporter permease subunit [Phreatobacter sp.]|uniref:molybdate ABC transporter permease subunit n=1 Tax=Phreatobacter sp. TaxID=1966341 RepID=UPI003F725D71
MDWTALSLSLQLGAATVAVLGPLAFVVARWLAFRAARGRGLVEALLALPLVLPPTVLGYYLLVALGAASPVGQLWQALFGRPLVFSFEALLVASVIANVPFAVQPMVQAFRAIPAEVREAAAVSGMVPGTVLRRIDLPLAWPGIVTGMILTFAHTLGEFGVVLMVGGSIPGETRTLSIAIYDRVQAFDDRGAGIMSAVLMAVSVAALLATTRLSGRVARRHG